MTNLPFPRWWMVLGFFWAGSIQALTTARTKRLYFLTSRVSATMHSRLAKHSATSGRDRRQAEAFELLHVPARTVADLHDCRRQLACANGDYALFRRPQRGEAVIGAADDTGDQRRFELDHHVPRHRNDVGAALVRRRQKDHRPRLEQLIDFRQGQIAHGCRPTRFRRSGSHGPCVAAAARPQSSRPVSADP